MALPLQKSRPTQKDIAKALGISQAAVAMALNAKTQWKLTPETVAQVQAKAAEMNYSPQRQASILRSGRSHTIGMVFASGLYYAPQARVKMLARAAIRAGYQLVAVDTDWFERDMAQVVNYLKGAAAEAVILCNIDSLDLCGWARTAQYDWPVLNMSTGNRGAGDNVYDDMEDAFYRMTLHHLELGSRTLTLLLPFHEFPPDSQFPAGLAIRHRLKGFRRAIREWGHDVFTTDRETSQLLDAPLAEGSASDLTAMALYYRKDPSVRNAFEHGAWYIHRLRSLGGRLPESLICSNDDIAAGALQACQEYRIKVPDAVRVSGADDAPFALYCGTPITTIAQNTEEMANYCIERVVQLIENPSLRAIPVEKSFRNRIVIRRSTSG